MTNVARYHFFRHALAALLLLAPVAGHADTKPAKLGIFETSTDIGAVRTPGTAAYDEARRTYTLTGSGANMWATSDESHVVWREMKGDFILTARVAFGAATAGANPHRKLGLVARASLEPDAPYADVALHGDGLASLQFRRAKGAETEEKKSDVSAPDVLQIERHGADVTMSVARFGDPFASATVEGVAPAGPLVVGLFVCAHDADRVETATFKDVRLVVPAGPELVPYRDYLGSHVELLDLDTGDREIVSSVTDSIQAPNWLPDGKHLIYNRNGRLYRFDLAARTATEIDTGSVTSNNNDHVLSFDGKMLAISSGSKEDGGQSVGYTVPVGGGTPRRVTVGAPSYMHGWSPDKKFLVFTAQRNGDFDIYRIPAEGGQETRLTTAKGLDDGPEYSPDGRWVYFNSTRTGKMQLWRMKPDGSGQERVTNDELNDWFPHISPDGKHLVFISFGDDVKPDDHPFYKHVYIREMPVSGGAPRVVAYLYGGQGTINVPSWSPDSRRVAFVSNSGAY